MSTTDEQELAIITAAEARAALASHLANNPGIEFAVGDIADKVGIARSTAGQHLAKMADGGLINMRAEGTKKMYSTGEVRSASESAKPSAKTPLRAKAKVNTSDIELAVKGVCSIIIGRSAAGRLRIQIEELS